MIEIAVTFKGPLFDGRAEAAADRLAVEVVDTVGAQALAEWHLLLDQSIQNPTPYYETQLVSQRVGTSRVVHDRGIVYGPWLERGRPGTSFRGYHAMRRAAQTVERRALQLARPAVARFLKEARG